jgi:hypothetical protein
VGGCWLGRRRCQPPLGIPSSRQILSFIRPFKFVWSIFDHDWKALLLLDPELLRPDLDRLG